MMFKRYNFQFKSIVVPVYILSILINLDAQPLEREVVVTKDFKPIIQDAQRIEIQPGISDTVRIKPSFSYKIYPIPAKSNFEIKPIKPAKLVGIPVTELYNYYLKAGLGNRHLPLIRLYMNNLRSEDHLIGAAIDINNIEGKMDISDQGRVNASNRYMRITGYGKKFFNMMNLEGDLGYERSKVHYYGLKSDTVFSLLPKAKDIKQNINTLFFHSKLYPTKLNPVYSYSLDFREQYTWDRLDYFENDAKFIFLNKVKVKNLNIHADADARIISNNIQKETDTIVTTSLIRFSPYFSNQNGEFRYKLGMHLTFEAVDKNVNAYLHPLAGIEYSPAGSIITTFFGLDGKYSPNSYKDVLEANPFVKAGSYARSSDNRLKAFAGIKGDITKSLSYQIDGEVKNIKDHPLFVIDTIGELDNYYKIIYGDVDIIQIGASVKYQIKEKLDIFFRGNNYVYDAGTEPHAWHLPKWDLNFSSSYNMQDKVVLKADLNVLGKRYARDLNEQTVELKPFAVFDLQIDYNFSKVLSVFVNIQNLNAAQYDLWYQYPYFKTMVIVGGAYKF